VPPIMVSVLRSKMYRTIRANGGGASVLRFLNYFCELYKLILIMHPSIQIFFFAMLKENSLRANGGWSHVLVNSKKYLISSNICG
ncbi:MAG TPA: hypothetical protein VJ201_06990, partial [Candidatus Babeliales bacterium]|nr:hypothetical protein [Candidatus Babeliales bacterium]